MTERFHLFPSRTQKLSSPVLKVLGWTRPGRISRCRIPISPGFARVKGAFLSFWGRENPPRERLGAGMRLSFPMILVFSAGSRGHWKQTKSAVALWTPSPPMLQWERRGVGERMTDQHAGIVCSCHQLNRAKGSPEGRRPFGGVKGRSPLRLLVKKEKYFCKSSRNFRGSVEIYKHKDRERT